jgi:uncharacterized protein with GYD domain
MARFLMEGTAGPQAVAALVKNPQDRTVAVRGMFEKVGGRVEAYYFAVGSVGKWYVIFELPDPADAATIESLMAAVYATGVNLSISVTQILTATEMIQVFKKAGDVAYRAPS